MGNVYAPFVRVTTGSFFTTLDPGTSAPRNTLGTIYSPPVAATLATTSAGYAAQPVVKYVLYNSTSNPNPVAAPAPVYYTDESFTTVSGNSAEAFFTTGGACIAGYLLPNSTSIASLTNTQLNNSFCWIQVGGLLVGAYAPTTLTGAGVGSQIYGTATGNWTSIVNTTIAASARSVGIQWKAIASSACDVLVNGQSTFWGS